MSKLKDPLVTETEIIITSIDERNKSWFQRFVPDYILGGMKENYRFGLGMIDKEGNAKGVLIFDMQDGSNEEVPLDGSYDLLCAYFQCWGFVFGLTDQCELLIQMSEKKIFAKIPEIPMPHVCSLRRVSAVQFRKYIENISKKPYADSRWSEKDKDYDMDVSCCYLDSEKIVGALLVKKISDHYIEIRHLGMSTENQRGLLELISYAKKEAERLYTPETYVDITYASEMAGKMLDYFFRDREPLLVRRGVLDLMEEQGEEIV